jgi:hypothetical protein
VDHSPTLFCPFNFSKDTQTPFHQGPILHRPNNSMDDDLAYLWLGMGDKMVALKRSPESCTSSLNGPGKSGRDKMSVEIFVLSTLSTLTTDTLSSHSKKGGRSSSSSSLFQFFPLPHHSYHSYHDLLLYNHPCFLHWLWILVSHGPFWRSESSGPGDRVDPYSSGRFALVLYYHQGFPSRLWVFLVEYAPSTSLQFSRLYRGHS